MSLRMRDAMAGLRAELRHEPTEKRVRAMLGDEVVVDSTRAVLVWEPRRLVPSYAVPQVDVRAEVVSDGPVQPGGPAMLHPGIPFGVHSTAGESLSLRVGGRTLSGAAFRPADPDLAGHLLLDTVALDRWYEEDEQVHSHPRDPYHLVDARASSRHVRIEHAGRVLADTRRATLVFETGLPTRFYLPRADVVADLSASDRRTYCPYKGEASYWSTDGLPDIAWAYLSPLPDAVQLAGLVAFYDDVLDVSVDGTRRPPSDNPIAATLLDEFDVPRR